MGRGRSSGAIDRGVRYLRIDANDLVIHSSRGCGEEAERQTKKAQPTHSMHHTGNLTLHDLFRWSAGPVHDHAL
jgi:hypothetical protein